MTELTYKLTDKIDYLFIKFFENHHKEMMFRTHGHWPYRHIITVPFDVAKQMVILGTWQAYETNCMVSFMYPTYIAKEVKQKLLKNK